MTVSYVERDQADAETLKFYDRAEERFQALLNIFKVFGHHPEYGTVFPRRSGSASTSTGANPRSSRPSS